MYSYIAYSATALTEFCIVLFNIVLSDSAHDNSDIVLSIVILRGVLKPCSQIVLLQRDSSQSDSARRWCYIGHGALR